MAKSASSGGLFDESSAPSTTIHVSLRCCVRVQDGHWVVLGSGIALLHFAEGDAMAKAHAIVSIVEQGWATQVEAARAFGVTTRTVRRQIERFDRGGLSALGRCGGYPAGRSRRPAARLRLIERLKKEGRLSNRQIAERVGIDEKAVRKALRRLGWDPEPHPQFMFEEVVQTPVAPEPAADPNLSGSPADPNLSASEEEPIPSTSDTDPADRRMDRLFASLGLLDDAAPLFRPGERVPGAGVLLAICAWPEASGTRWPLHFADLVHRGPSSPATSAPRGSTSTRTRRGSCTTILSGTPHGWSNERDEGTASGVD